MTDLERRWRAQGAPLVGALRPGLTDDEIDTQMRTLGVDLPEEARRWWRWHDGVAFKTTVDVQTLGRDLAFISLSQAIAAYQDYRRVADNVTDGDPTSLWHPSWFPLVISATGAAVVCDTTVAPGAPSPTRMVDWHSGRDPRQTPVVASFGHVVHWWIDAFDEGIWGYDAQAGLWRYDWERLDDERRSSGLV